MTETYIIIVNVVLMVYILYLNLRQARRIEDLTRELTNKNK